MPSVNVNCPFQVHIAMDGTVSIATQSSVDYNLSTPDVVFQGILTDAILKAFVVSVGAEGTRKIHVDLDSTKIDAFVGSICNNLDLAPTDSEAAEADIVNLKKYLLKFAKDTLMAQLNASGVNDAMEQGALDDIALDDYATDICDGAIAMKDGINALNPDTRALFFTQIGNSKLMSRWGTDGKGGSQESVSSSYPLGPDDKLTMQFIITQTYEVSENPYSYGGNILAGTRSGAVAFGADPSVAPVLGHYGVAQRIVNLVLTRMSDDAYLGDAVLEGGLKGQEKGSPGVMPTPADAAYEIPDKKTAYEDALTAAKNAYSAWESATQLKAIWDTNTKNLAAAAQVRDDALAARTAAAAAAVASPQNTGLQLAANQASAAYDVAFARHAGLPAPGTEPTVPTAPTSAAVNTAFGNWQSAVTAYNTALNNWKQKKAYNAWYDLRVAESKLSAEYELLCQQERAVLAQDARDAAYDDLVSTPTTSLMAVLEAADSAVGTALADVPLATPANATETATMSEKKGIVNEKNAEFKVAFDAYNLARVAYNDGPRVVLNAANTAWYNASLKTDAPIASPAVVAEQDAYTPESGISSRSNYYVVA